MAAVDPDPFDEEQRCVEYEDFGYSLFTGRQGRH